MKRLLICCIASLVFSFITFITANDLHAESQIASLKVLGEKTVYTNGDVLRLAGDNFPPSAEITAVLLDVYQADGITDIKRLTNKDLFIDYDGRLSGSVVLEGLETDEDYAQISIFVQNGNTLPSIKFQVKGSLASTSNPMGPATAASFDFTDASGDGIVQVGEVMNISTSGTGWGGVLGSRRYEYDSGQTEITYINLGTGSLYIDGSSQLAGSVANSSTAYNTNTAYMRLWVIDDDFTSAFSDTYHSTIDNIAPNLSDAIANDMTHIDLTFDEAVSQVGNAANLFVLTGADAGSITISSIAAVGSQPTTTWRLAINTFVNRSVGDVDIAYVANGTDSLKDAAGNEVADTSPARAVKDNIAPATPSLTNPSLSTIMNGSVTLQATADDDATDPSISGVTFQGSNNGSSWTDIGSDNSTTDSNYEYAYSFGTKYAYYRAVARDDGANLTTNSSSVGDLSDAHMVGIPSYPATQDVGVRGEIVAAIQNNYSDSVTYEYPVGLTFNLSTDQSSTGTFYDAASGGSAITSIVISANKMSKRFWYADNLPSSTPTITVTETGNNLDVSSTNQQLNILSVPFDHFYITTENSQNEVAGTAFSITVEAHDAGESLVTGVVGNYSLTWTTTATASPDGTNPATPSDGTFSFTSGATTVNSNALYNSAETPYIRVTDGTHSTADLAAGNAITVADAASYEVRVKTTAETGEEQYAQNVYGSATFQGPTQANPDKITSLYGVIYDSYGNLVDDADAGDWSKPAGLLSTFSTPNASPNTDLTFDDLSGTNTTYSGTVAFTSTATYGNVSGSTGTIEVDDAAPGTIGYFNIDDSQVPLTNVQASWSPTIYDDGTNSASGSVASYDIKWVTEASGAIDNDTKWDAATSVGSSGKPSFYSAFWDIDMSGFPSGNKYFAIRASDDVGNLSPIKYLTTIDYSLPVSLSAFTAKTDYGKIVLNWETASEVENAGFFIYRSESETGNFVQINQQIIPGHVNSNTTNSYEYTDRNLVENSTYYYKLGSRDVNGAMHSYGKIVSATALPLPKDFALDQNYPNPFNPSTHLKFSVAKEGNVNLDIYNMLGQKVRTLLNNARLAPGVYDDIVWDARDGSGNPVSNGIYYVILTVKDYGIHKVRKIVYTK